MANTLITSSIIAQEGLFQLENNCVMGDRVHRRYKNEFVKVGDTVTIRKPVKFVAKSGATRQNQDVTQRSTSIQITEREHVSWSFSSLELTLDIDEYSEQFIKPAMIALANKVDTFLCTLGAINFFNSAGTPGNTPDDFTDLTGVATIMDDEPVPDDGERQLVLNPAARWGMTNGLKGLFNADMVHGFVRRGKLGEVANFSIWGDQNIYRHTVGTYTGTPLVNDASFANNTNVIAFNGMTGSQTAALKAGDVFTIDGVFSVNDVSKQSTGVLQQFVVLADVDTTAGAGSITCYPTLDDGSESATEAYQTVSALPANDAGINILGTAATAYPQNLGFHRNALALVTVPLEMPDSAVFKARSSWRGYSLRVIKAYDIDADEEAIRLDILFGGKAIYPELGVRLWG